MQIIGSVPGFELPIVRLEGKWKMSQNRSQADRLGTMAGLSASVDPQDQAVAAIMQALEMERR